MVDLRKDKRAPASLKVKYKSATVDEFIEQFGGDVSRSGVFIKTKKPIENGALLKLELQLNDASPVIAGIGRVCWRREAAPDPSLPAGMGIKLIKLDPDSRAIIDRIVEGRGAKPSRFDQTQGAEVASASEPPPADTGSLAPVPAAAVPAMPQSVSPVPAAAPKAAAPLPAPPAAVVAPRMSAAKPPGLPPPAALKPSLGARPPAAKVAGLFADSPLARNAALEPKAEVFRPSSFFPPAPNASPFGAAPRAAAAGASDNKLTPPPPAIGSVPPPAPASSVPPAARASQARQSGQFLAAAFAEGGLAEETASQARAAAQSSEDELIDELFAGVVDEEPATRSVPAPPLSAAPRPVETSVDDVFAALSEEEGLSEPPAGRRSSSPSPSAARASATGGFGRGDEATTKEMPSLRPPPGRASGDDLEDGADAFGDDENFGEADLFASQAPRGSVSGAPGAGVVPPLPVAPQQQPAAKRSSMLPIVLLVLLALGGAGAYFYYQRYMAPGDEASQASEAAAPPSAAQPAAAAEPQAAEPAQAPAPAQPATPAAAAQPQAQAARPAPSAAPEQMVEVEVSSLPRDSDITVDGKKVGTTPKHVNLPVGREAHVTVSAAGYAPMTKNVVASASTEPLRFKLEPLPFTLVVRTTPPEASLSVGRATATSPAPLELGHVDGGVQVSIAKDGFQRMTRLVRFDEFAEKDGVMRAEIEVTLSPLPGGVPSVSAKAHGKRPHGATSSEGPPSPEPSTPEAEPAKTAAAAAPSEPAPEKAAPAASKPLPEGRPPEPGLPSTPAAP